MSQLEKNSILVVDDEKVNLEILRKILSSEYTVYLTKSGTSSIEIANKVVPDLILLDIIMPDMNGLDVLKTLKSSEKTKNIPVIIISGLESMEDEENSLFLGAVDFIRKPLRNNIVLSRIRHQIQIVNQIHVIQQYANHMYTSATKMEAIVDNFKGVIWSIDANGVITSFNGQYLHTIGVSPAYLIGKNIQIARSKNIHVDIIDNIEKTFREGPQDWQSDINGVVFHSHTTLLYDKNGNISGLVGTSNDITELSKLHKDLEAAVKSAEDISRTKSSFLAKTSHEIRTPLNAILGIAEIQLQNVTIQQDIKEAFTRIFNSGDLLLGIINDILDLSKIEARRMELIEAEYNVSGMISETVFLNVIRYESKPIDFILNVDENIPATLFGDELRIKQVLNNILSNAFKYTKTGKVELSVNAEISNNEITLVLSVRDTGQGMTAEQIERLFDAYSRFNKEANKSIVGTGLGMAITQNLINLMKGEISVESEIGKGSLFTIRLPQGNTGAAALGRETVEKIKQFRSDYQVKPKNIQIVREPIPFGKVLVVDDIDMNLYVAKGLLSLYGLQVDTALSGQEAIEKTKNNKYDIVFMDHMMPVMDGIETTKKIRELGEKYEKLPIIALTANAISGVKEMFLASGFNGFLPKPIPTVELDEMLRTWLSPEKIMQNTRQETADTEKTNGAFPDEVGKIDEIDTKAGLNHLLNDKNIYYNTLEKFFNKLVSECSSMNSSLEAKDLENFKISVHAMKSMLAIIGALSLSETALGLEIASKNQDINFCVQNFPGFKEKLIYLHKQLSCIFSGREENKEAEKQQETHHGDKKYENKKVLIVDDMDMILYVIKEKLTPYGLHVDTATSGAEAIEKIKDTAYDIVFMDHMMPEMDGIEATKKIKELGPNFEKIPIIALTANTEDGIEDMYLANGFSGFLSKPVVKERMEVILQRWLASQ